MINRSTRSAVAQAPSAVRWFTDPEWIKQEIAYCHRRKIAVITESLDGGWSIYYGRAFTIGSAPTREEAIVWVEKNAEALYRGEVVA